MQTDQNHHHHPEGPRATQQPDPCQTLKNIENLVDNDEGRLGTRAEPCIFKKYCIFFLFIFNTIKIYFSIMCKKNHPKFYLKCICTFDYVKFMRETLCYE